MLTLAALLADRLRADGASPLVTFYDDATGERTELSTATFANWVAKTANLLVDGLGLGPGDEAALALPLHWQSLVVAAGCWAAGVDVRFDGPADAAFAAEGGPVPTADEVVVLSLRPMGAGLAVPDGAVTDYVEVLTYGDRFAGVGPAPTDLALPGVAHAALCVGPGEARRVLMAPADDPMLDEELLGAAYLGPLRGGGSVVLVRHPDVTRLEARAAEEHAVRTG